MTKQAPPAPVDRYGIAIAPGGRYFLNRRNPLAVAAAGAPAMVLMVYARQAPLPLLIALTVLLALLIGAKLSARSLRWLLLWLPLLVLLTSFTFGLWAEPLGSGRSVMFQIGGFSYTWQGWNAGLATAARFGAIIYIALLSGLTTTGPDMVRAMVKQLHLPYRIGYSALAATRFVPQFGIELGTIKDAHRTRGISGRGPVAAVRRQLGYAVPLMAGGIRHAERVALAMDARAFGAHSTRTERRVMTFGVVDGVVMAGGWVLTAVAVILARKLT